MPRAVPLTREQHRIMYERNRRYRMEEMLSTARAKYIGLIKEAQSYDMHELLTDKDISNI